MSAREESVIPADIRGQVEDIFDNYGFDRDLLLGAICAALSSSQAEVERLRKALEPFAKWSKQMDIFYADDSDDAIVAGNHGTYITFGDLRTARSLASKAGAA
jgi:hypothetical protein